MAIPGLMSILGSKSPRLRRSSSSRTTRDSEEGVGEQVTVPLNNNQFAALVSFAFNAGNGALRGSTLRKKLNKKDY